MTKTTSNRFSPEIRHRAVRMVWEHGGDHASPRAAIGSIAAKIGCSAETLRKWIRQAERDQGLRAGPTTEDRERIKALEREVRELRQANEILRKASAYFAQAELDRRPKPSTRRVDPVPPGSRCLWHRQGSRSSTITAQRTGSSRSALRRPWPAIPCGTGSLPPASMVLPIAPSTYHAHAARRADPGKASARARRDAGIKVEIRRVFEANFGVYGVRKVWRQLGREGIGVARCTVARLMRQVGLRGVIRGKGTRTTVTDKATPCPADRVNRQFRVLRPNLLWRSGFTYVATWQGFVDVAFIIDAFAGRVVGWRASRTARAGFVLDALEQALHDRRPVQGGGLVHHSDRGVQYVSIRYTERPADAGIEPSVGSVGDSYDDALAETVIGLFKTEVIRRLGPWRSLETVELATLDWVDRFNNRRLLESIGNIPPAEAEARYYAQLEEIALAA